MTIKLKKPIQYDGETVTEINLDLDSLTGQDMINAEKEADVNQGVPVKEFEKSYLSVLAAKASGKPSDMIPLLGVKDFSRVTVEVQNFLFGEE